VADSFLKSLQRVLTGGAPGYALPAPLFLQAGGGLFVAAPQVIVPAASVTPNVQLGPWIKMTFAANTVCVIQLPSNVPNGLSWRFTITIINTSGGNLTNLTFAAGYKNAALTFPATANNRSFFFNTDGVAAYEEGQTAADVAN
jgi:hypothetical protein